MKFVRYFGRAAAAFCLIPHSFTIFRQFFFWQMSKRREMFLPRFKKDKSFPVKNYDFSAKILFENENSCFSRFLQHCFTISKRSFIPVLLQLVYSLMTVHAGSLPCRKVLADRLDKIRHVPRIFPSLSFPFLLPAHRIY